MVLATGSLNQNWEIGSEFQISALISRVKKKHFGLVCTRSKNSLSSLHNVELFFQTGSSDIGLCFLSALAIVPGAQKGIQIRKLQCPSSHRNRLFETS